MSAITVRPVQSKGDTTRFIKFLWKVYENSPYWVPPLLMDRRKLMDTKKNPFYKHAAAEFFIAERDGEMVGRIAAIVNENHNKEHGDKVGFFGFFESIDDAEVAGALLNKAKEFLRSKGMAVMRGPANPSVNDEYGLLVDGFDFYPAVLMTYNPPYYEKLLEGFGLRKAKDLYAYRMTQDTVGAERLERANRIVRERHQLEFRTLDMKNFDRDVGLIKEIFNKAWAKNWGAVPMTNDEIDAMAKDLKPIVVPDLVIFAETKGKTVGFALSLPDINRALRFNKKGRLLPGLFYLTTKKKEIRGVRVIVLGVLPEYLNSGAPGVLFYETQVRAKKLGYEYGEASWILEDNLRMTRAAEKMNGRIEKTYRIYDIPIA